MYIYGFLRIVIYRCGKERDISLLGRLALCCSDPKADGNSTPTRLTLHPWKLDMDVSQSKGARRRRSNFIEKSSKRMDICDPLLVCTKI